MKAFSILDTIGNTPLISINGVFVKLETFNPTGSIKDRMAWHLVKMAEKRGDLTPGMKIIEVTSGNTGVALAMIASIRNYQFTAIMPEAEDDKWKKLIQSYSAKVIVTPARNGLRGALRRYEQLIQSKTHTWLPKQFENQDNVEAYRQGLGREILDGMHGRIDAFVAGAGTGGTIVGVSQTLKRHNPDIKTIVIEPAESKVLSGGKPGIHQIRGIGQGFIPEILKKHIDRIDEVISVKSADAISTARRLRKKYGLQVGTSSGANMWAAESIKARYKRIVTVFPDRGYLS